MILSKIGFHGGDFKDDDFLLFPTIAIGAAELNNKKAVGVGIRFGFWGIYFAIILLKAT